LLARKYGKSKFYTKSQVERTVTDEKLNKKFLYCGYLFYVDPTLANTVIIEDQSSYNDIEDLKRELGELFRVENINSFIEEVKDEIFHSSSISEHVDSCAFSGGSNSSSGSSESSD
jgi:hypothetical protein